MRSLIPTAVILFLAVTFLETNGFKFGDIISFERSVNFVKYKHFAVYVGKGIKHGLPKTKTQDIFGHVKNCISPKCLFSELNYDEDPKVDNYLDGYTDPITKVTFQRGTDEEIRQRILETSHKCKRYRLLSNNCEHLATYIRYGYGIAVQFNRTGERFCLNNPAINKRALVRHLKKQLRSD
ncbi:phospholipase A and acyltransferase 1-like [Cyprinodon tularosa]|uniref:phospholipase A and acyltransferase 1-like n=1 Tax=Cyprinodon tularosa TaxID=77115 RepID=UPI0018E27954|nr:phospholipase A and acyltransferase 1-like [Cyprinodon tularosa]